MKVQDKEQHLITIPATPAIYRAVKEKGIEVETVVKPQIGSGVVVEYQHTHYPAALDAPYDRDVHQYKIAGQVLERRYYLPGAKTPVATQSATDQQENKAKAK